MSPAITCGGFAGLCHAIAARASVMQHDVDAGNLGRGGTPYQDINILTLLGPVERLVAPLLNMEVRHQPNPHVFLARRSDDVRS